MAGKKYLDFSGLTELVNKLKAFFQKKEFSGTHDEWNQLTPAEKANYEIVNFTDDLECAYQDVYSTEEVKTNKVWVDGKPIYRKVINLGILPNTTSKQISHNISNYDYVTKLYGTAMDQNKLVMPLPRASVIPENCFDLNITATSVVISTGVDRTNFSGYAVVEYTKTTD